MTKEEAFIGKLVDVEKDGEHGPGVIISAPSPTGLVKVQLAAGGCVVRHHDRLAEQPKDPQ